MTIAPTPSSDPNPFQIQVRIKSLLETANERGHDTTTYAIFMAFRHASSTYYQLGSGQAYAIQLSAWCEDFRTEIEYCVNYLIAFKDAYWNELFEDVYERIEEIMRAHLVRSRQRKLGLLAA